MSVTDQDKQHVRGLLIEGKRIHAIKYVSDNFGLGLKEAKELVDLIDQDIRDDEYVRPALTRVRASGKGGARIVSAIFALIGLVFLSIAIMVFMNNQQLANVGTVVTATVVDDPYQPVFEYVVNYDTLYHYSSTSSDPPSYSLGEKVEMFVHPDNPYNVLVNTFMERWFLVVLLGGMGSVFFFIGLVSFFAFRKS